MYAIYTYIFVINAYINICSLVMIYKYKEKIDV